MIKASKLHVTDPLVAVGGYGWKGSSMKRALSEMKREKCSNWERWGGEKKNRVKKRERERERERIMIINKNNV